MAFNKDFLWGAASAATQVEGAYQSGGKSLSIWDVASPKKIRHGENCHNACDHYNRYKEDVALMKELGLNSYRFSISWPRIMPKCGEINQEGIDFYNNLIDELLANGIEPLVTIFHWDTPLWAYKKGGWLTKKIVDWFCEYTKVVVDAFSDRVKYWIPMNEPQCFILYGYFDGIHAPFKLKRLSLNRLTKNCMMAFSESVKTIRARAKTTPKIGIAMASGAFIPRVSGQTELAKARLKTFSSGEGLMFNRWWGDPILLGKGVSLNKFYRISDKFAQSIYQPLDFLGLNLYGPYTDEEWESGESKENCFGCPRSTLDWKINEKVMYYAPKFMYERYHLPIMITENGLCLNDWVCQDGKIHDTQRTDFLYRYLKELKNISDTVPIIGYQHWSIMDNFEWNNGYDPRFGLVYVDYKTGNRIIKSSGYEYKKIILSNGDNL